MRPLLSLIPVALVVALAGCNPTPQTSTTDAGSTTNAGTQTANTTVSGPITLGMMPKQVGIPYFNACQVGAQEAAKELGDVKLVYDGPSNDRSEDQSGMLDTWVTQQMNAVAVACNDPDQIAQSLVRARDEGLTVVTFDADANAESSKRQFFVNQVGVKEIATRLVEEMVKQVGPKAKVAVVSSSSTAPNQSVWLKAMEEYRKEKYPDLKVLAPEYAGEDQIRSRQKAESILKAEPDVKGIWGMTSVALPGAAQAVEAAGKTGQVAVVGLGTPKVMKEFVDRGVVKSVVLWNPVDLGYATVHVARATARGELKPGATTFKAGRLGELQVQGTEVLLGEPLVFTKDNIAKYDF